jgi:alpha-L-arabinofuranosidase
MNDVQICLRRMACSVAVMAVAVTAATIQAAPPVTMTIQAGQPAHAMSPTLYGVFFEDINYAADGGLYAEMLQNRSFEFTDKGTLFGWTMVRRGSPLGNMVIETERPINTNNPHFLRMQVSSASEGVGVRNDGFDGLLIEKGSNYVFSMWGRSLDSRDVRVVARLETAQDKPLGEMLVSRMAPDWHQFSAVIKAKDNCTNAHLSLLIVDAGTYDFDMVSLFPEHTFKNRPNGMRADLAQMVADLKPSFVRFPGGCIVEGKNLANRYRWKDTIGRVEERRGNWNRWQSAMPEAPAPLYNQSYGLGFFEFFQFCEDIGAEPLPILNCGMSCQYQDGELVPLDQLDPYIQDALDLIEFANGAETSEWGAKRAAMGHPLPFNMKYLGVGNEQWGDAYFERYNRFFTVLKAGHPEIRIVSSAGPQAEGADFDKAWEMLRGSKADLVDEHYYRQPLWFINHADRYDRYDRNGPKVFAGEYAAHTPSRRNSLEAALAEAAFMTGLERNSDVVEMASYAPLFARAGAVQWPVDLIWFDNLHTYGTPAYYVQKLFSQNRGEQVLALTLSDPASDSGAAGGICLGTYHTGAEFKDIRVTRGSHRLFAADFESDMRGWRTTGGDWVVKEGKCRQSKIDVVATASAGDEDWTDYTLTLKARKISGDEGFLIGVRNINGGSKVQWNLGGWGNTKHGIQDLTGGNDRIVEQVPGAIETDRWYDVKVELKGAHLNCYLDGVLVQSVDVPGLRTQRVFATACRDPKTDCLILKAVNPTSRNVEAKIQLEGLEHVGARGEAIVLTGESQTDENSFLTPVKVAPKTLPVTGLGKSFRYKFQANSLTVLRIPAER